jgi:ATP-binding cassette, subfamily C, bacterial
MESQPPSLARMIEPRPAAWLGLLMLAGAVTEGIGLVLLVPLLAALGGEGGGRLAAWLEASGLPLRLEVLLALFVALVALRALITQARLMATQRFELTLVDRLRRRTWRALLHCDWRVLLGMRQADSASLLITDIERIGFGVQQAVSALAIVVTLGGIGLAALTISPAVTAGAALAGLAVLAAYAGLRRRAQALGEALGEAYAATHASLGEGLGALRVIKSLEGEDRAEAQAMAGFAAMRRAQIAYMRDRGLGQGALQLGGALALALLVWLAARRWSLDAVTILPMVALFARALPLLGALQEAWLNWRHARPALDATLALIAAAEAAREPEAQGVAAPALNQAIELADVTLRFGEGPAVLDRVSLTFAAGSITALTGPSGAGKSTLADLVGGLLSPDTGSLSIDGTLLDPPLRRAWRRRVAYVQQEPVLLAASIRDNLAWGTPGASEAAMQAALSAASAQFVAALPEGLDTRVGDGGRVLSGGERQRLMLARALLRRPALLILDEAASALDSANEIAIAAAIAALRGQITVLIIGHRGALAEIADLTITLEDGQVAQIDARC